MSLVIAMLARTTEVGSRTLVHAIQPDLETGAHGAFLMGCKIAKYASHLLTKYYRKVTNNNGRNGSNIDGSGPAQTQERFRRELFEVLEQIQPGITSNATP